jgi:hypothetical protein
MNEHRGLHQRLSLSYCKAKYGHYGVFSVYPLLTAVLNSDVYDLEVFEKEYDNYTPNSEFADYVNGLKYEDKRYFTIDETRFLLKLVAPCQVLNEHQIESDLREVMAEVSKGTNMLNSHARIVLKAIQYWKSRHNEKLEEWMQKFSKADEASLDRRACRNVDKREM